MGKGGSLRTKKLTIVLQFPNFVRSTDLKAGYGKVRYDETTKECRWEIGVIPPNLSGDKVPFFFLLIFVLFLIF